MIFMNEIVLPSVKRDNLRRRAQARSLFTTKPMSA
jgi:hypothetical protein